MTGLTGDVDVVVETLHSIRDQTYPHPRVAISVDGGDRASAAIDAFMKASGHGDQLV